jgi:hypothetical protein
VTGTGTTNYLPKFTGASTIGNSIVSESGSVISVAGNLNVGSLGNFAINAGSAATPLLTQSTNFTELYRRSGGVGIYLGDTGNPANYYDNSIHYFRSSGGGATRMTLDNSGNLGLGVTPSAWTLFSGVLELNGGPAIGGFANTTYFLQNSNFDSGFKYKTTGTAGRYELGGQHSWWIAPSGTAGNAISFTQAMTLNASGNLGLGTTPSPWTAAHKVFQFGAIGSLETDDDAVALSNNRYFDGANKYRANDFASIFVQVNGQHQWYTAPSGIANNTITFTQAMTLNASGRLLLGTTSDDGVSRLQVSGTIRTLSGNLDLYANNVSANFYDSSNSNYLYSLQNYSSQFRLYNNNTSTTVLNFASTGAATFSSSVTATNLLTTSMSGTVINIRGTETLNSPFGITWTTPTYTGGLAAIRVQRTGAADASDMIFLTAPNGDIPNERMRITSGGNVLINTTSDDGSGSKLQVNGTITQSNYTYHANNAAGQLNAATWVTTSITLQANHLGFYEVYVIGHENGRNQAVRVYFVYYNTNTGWNATLASTNIDPTGNDYGVVNLRVTSGGVLEVQAFNLISMGQYRIVVMNQFKN